MVVVDLTRADSAWPVDRSTVRRAAVTARAGALGSASPGSSEDVQAARAVSTVGSATHNADRRALVLVIRPPCANPVNAR
jgi:hypothetical protein